MRVQDLHVLPKFRDGWSCLYMEHCKVEQEDRASGISRKTELKLAGAPKFRDKNQRGRND